MTDQDMRIRGPVTIANPASEAEVAYKLWQELRPGGYIETDEHRREQLQLYAECLQVVKFPQYYNPAKFKATPQ